MSPTWGAAGAFLPWVAPCWMMTWTAALTGVSPPTLLGQLGTFLDTGECWGNCPGWLTGLPLVEVMVVIFQ